MIGLQVISRGMQHRRKGSHELNVESSRSHSIMTVYCHASAEEGDESGASLATMGKINFVDLVSNPCTNAFSDSAASCMPPQMTILSLEDRLAASAGHVGSAATKGGIDTAAECSATATRRSRKHRNSAEFIPDRRYCDQGHET